MKHNTKISMLIAGMIMAGTMSWAQTKTETRRVSAFRKLEVGSSANVKLVKSDTPYVIVEADEDIIKQIETEVEKEELEIEFKGKRSTNGFKVTVGYQNLESIEAKGAASISNSDILASEKLKLETTGASRIKLQVDAKQIDANASGAASIVLKGKADFIDADVTGAAYLKAANLVVKTAELSVSGAATGSVQATEKLTGDVSGAGTLKYIGNPTNKSLQKSGAGSIKIITEEGTTSEEARVTVVNQETKSENGDTTSIRIGSRKIYIVEDEDKHTKKHKDFFDDEFNHWAGVELAQSGWMTWDNKFTMTPRNKYMEIDYGWRNVSWNLNLMEKDFRIIKNHMQLVTGLGFSFNNYQFRNRTTLNADSAYTWYRNDSLINFRKNRLKVNYLSVPLMLEFNTGKSDNRNFHIAVGAVGYIKLNSKTKQTYRMDGDSHTNIRKDDYNLSPFRVDATLRIGYNDFTLFANYGLTEMFQKERGPQLYPFQVGLRIVPF